jgi:A/G-specific adenine glycosylase
MQNFGFSDSIIAWYRAHKRALPWRNTTDPYPIWISEIILQQTRVDQGLGYYYRILEAFPKVSDMANASEDQLLKLWQGLGYYSRARNMHNTAKIVHNEHLGQFPANYDGLIQLKGIGPYTAAAIASFCFLEPVAVVDGNVERVLCRFFGIDEPIDATSTRKIIRSIAQELIPLSAPDQHNQAIMEFGALQCTPKNPDCQSCVLVENCMARQLGVVARLPYKAKRTKVKQLFLDYWVHSNGKELAFRKRTGKGIWENLFDFPCLERDDDAALDMAANYSNGASIVYQSEVISHLLSHRKLRIRFHLLFSNTPIVAEEVIWIKLQEVHQLAVPKPIHDFLKEAKKNNWWGMPNT